MFFHGRETYRKKSEMALNDFYKNVLIAMPQFWYAFYNGFSGTSFYDPIIYQLFNTAITSAPIGFYVTFDE
jgi:phospholipid-transporting ATPase